MDSSSKPIRRDFCSKSLLMILSLTLEGISNKKMNKKLVERFGNPSFETSLPAYKSKLLKFASKAYRAKLELEAAQARVTSGTMSQLAYDSLARSRNVFAMDFKSVQWTEREKLQIIEYGQRWIELQHHRAANSSPSTLQEPVLVEPTKTKEELVSQSKLLCDQLDKVKQQFASQSARPAWAMMTTPPTLLSPLPQPSATTWGFLQQQNAPMFTLPQYHLLLPQQQPQMYAQRFASSSHCYHHQHFQSGTMMMFPSSYQQQHQ